MKEAKKAYSFRLPAEVKEMIRVMAEYDKRSESEIIEWAVHAQYVQRYYQKMPEKFPPSRLPWVVP